MKNYYQLLGIDENATLDEIKAAYKLYVVKFHPDKHNDDPFFKERFQEIQEAYDFLIKNHGKQQQSAPQPVTIHFACQQTAVQEKGYLSFRWEIQSRQTCDITVSIHNGYSEAKFTKLPSTGIKTIQIKRIKEDVKLTLYCNTQEQSYQKEIHINKTTVSPRRKNTKFIKTAIAGIIILLYIPLYRSFTTGREGNNETYNATYDSATVVEEVAPVVTANEECIDSVAVVVEEEAAESADNLQQQ